MLPQFHMNLTFHPKKNLKLEFRVSRITSSIYNIPFSHISPDIFMPDHLVVNIHYTECMNKSINLHSETTYPTPPLHSSSKNPFKHHPPPTFILPPKSPPPSPPNQEKTPNTRNSRTVLPRQLSFFTSRYFWVFGIRLGIDV